MPAATTPKTAAEYDALTLAFWKERFPEMTECNITIRDAGGRMIGYRLVRVEGGAEEVSPADLYGSLAGV